ncbi:MAG: hypothetical protein Q8O99_00970 [bacterium]|nr:hypothetical protein [bacterium]
MRVRLDKKALIRDAFFYALAIGLVFWSFQNGAVSSMEAIVFLLLYVVYILFLRQSNSVSYEGSDTVKRVEEEIIHDEKVLETKFFLFRRVDYLIDLSFPAVGRRGWYVITFVISIVWIGVLSWLLVESGIAVASSLGISEVII